MHNDATSVSPELVQALTACVLPVSQRALELNKQGSLRLTTSARRSFQDVRTLLRDRLAVKVMQLGRARAEASRARLQTMHDAIALVVAWGERSPDMLLQIESLAASPDVHFVFWRRADTGEIISGFETRAATRLSRERGKEFFGADWEPTPDPGT